MGLQTKLDHDKKVENAQGRDETEETVAAEIFSEFISTEQTQPDIDVKGADLPAADEDLPEAKQPESQQEQKEQMEAEQPEVFRAEQPEYYFFPTCLCGAKCTYTRTQAFNIFSIFRCQACEEYSWNKHGKRLISRLYFCACDRCITPRNPHGQLRRYAGVKKTLPHFLGTQEASKTARWFFDQVFAAYFLAGPADRSEIRDLMDEAKDFLRLKPASQDLHDMLVSTWEELDRVDRVDALGQGSMAMGPARSADPPPGPPTRRRRIV